MRSSRKDILYIGGFELPDKNAAAHRVLANGKLLRELGYEVSYVGVKKDTNSEETLLKASLNDFNIWNQMYPSGVLEWLRYLTSISHVKHIIESGLVQKPLLIIAYNYPAAALYRLLKYSKRNKIALVSDTTEWYVPSGGIVFRTLKILDNVCRMKYIHQKLSGLIAISRYLYDYYKPRMSNVVLLPPLIDKADEKWNNLRNYNNSNVRQLVYAGSPGVGGKDRLDLIIAALLRVNKERGIEFKLTILGLTEGEYLRNFNSYPLSSYAKNRVVFKGRISHLECIQIITNSDYSIFIREQNLVNTAGFPTKFVESISCGTPVITNVSSNITDYLEEGKFGYFLDLSSDDQLANSITKALCQSNEQIRYMKNACSESNLFDFRNYKDLINQFIENSLLEN